MKALRVGLVFAPELLPILRDGKEVVSVLEVEPQTLWQLSRAHCREMYRLKGEPNAENKSNKTTRR